MSNIIIKGNKDGILIIINSDDYDGVKKDLVSKIDGARDFFMDSKIMIVDEKFKLKNDCFNDLQSTLREKFNITITLFDNENTERNEKIFNGIYEGKTKFIKNTIRSGQKIVYNGNIVVIGDINSGSEVIATGNIIVLGVLRGIAQAGSNGNKRAFVAAYKLQPEQLRIAEIIGRSPDRNNQENPAIPELAKIKGDMIQIEPYLPNKYV
jgi:septum site-determining protein MinC